MSTILSNTITSIGGGGVSISVGTGATYISDGGGSDGPNVIFNFGNPVGGFSISSGNADANGYGNFEYAPPSGYYALCSKNIGQFG